MLTSLLPFALPVLGYFLGSISFAWISGKLKGVNLKEHGSKNLGATNAGRVLGKQWFFIVFFLDLAKGLVLPLLIRLLLIDTELPVPLDVLAIITGLGAVLGHIFTCFHGFKGGKAVATSLGVLFGLDPVVAGLSFGVWVILWVFGRFILKLPASNAVGPASVLSVITSPFWRHYTVEANEWQGEYLPTSILVVCLSSLILIRHRNNIIAMLQKKEVAKNGQTEATPEN